MFFHPFWALQLSCAQAPGASSAAPHYPPEVFLIPPENGPSSKRKVLVASQPPIFRGELLNFVGVYQNLMFFRQLSQKSIKNQVYSQAMPWSRFFHDFSRLGTQKMGFQDDGRVGGVISPCSFLEICPVVGEGNLGPKISQGLFFDIISRWWQLKHVFMFTPNLGGNDPIWRVFFRWVETTN